MSVKAGAVRVVDHDPAWIVSFNAEATRITKALGDVVVRAHHIGSTAILQIKAKPIVDILLEVTSLGELDERASSLEVLGYEAMGELGIPGRRYFRLNDSFGTRTHQVHAFETGTENVARHLALRDYMRAHPLIAEEYASLKERLARSHPDDIYAYMDGKDAFVKEHERRALDWVRSRA